MLCGDLNWVLQLLVQFVPFKLLPDSPEAKLWLLIHLHKKDAEKVRWPDHLLEEHLQLESSFSSSAADEADEADDTVASD